SLVVHGLHHISVNRLAILTLETEELGVAELNVAQPVGVEVRHLSQTGSARVERVQVRGMLEVLTRGNYAVSSHCAACHGAIAEQLTRRAAGDVDGVERGLPFVVDRRVESSAVIRPRESARRAVPLG